MSDQANHRRPGLGTLILMCAIGLIAYLAAPYLLRCGRGRAA